MPQQWKSSTQSLANSHNRHAGERPRDFLERGTAAEASLRVAVATELSTWLGNRPLPISWLLAVDARDLLQFGFEIFQ